MHSKLTNRLRTFNRSIHNLDKITMPKNTCENLIGQKKSICQKYRTYEYIKDRQN